MLEETAGIPDLREAGRDAGNEAEWGGNLQLRNVLCPVDLSEASERALRAAVWIASHYQSRLYVQHTFPALGDNSQRRPGTSLRIEELPAELQSKEIELRRMIEKAGTGAVSLTVLLNDGDARERILETIRAREIDLMVIGTRGHRGLKRLVQGSLTERVVHEVSCPALVLNRRGAQAAQRARFDPLRLKNILVPVNLSGQSMRLVLYALRWAWEPASRVILLHTVETAPPALGKLSDLLPEYGSDIEKRLREADGKMRALVPFPNRLPCQMEFEVRDGEPKAQILRVAKERKADLILMGARMWAGPGSTLGSTIAGVIRDGRFPVLAIRHLAE
jgi:nucleotide-binding universal stress UspA family protein